MVLTMKSCEGPLLSVAGYAPLVVGSAVAGVATGRVSFPSILCRVRKSPRCGRVRSGRLPCLDEGLISVWLVWQSAQNDTLWQVAQRMSSLAA